MIYCHGSCTLLQMYCFITCDHPVHKTIRCDMFFQIRATPLSIAAWAVAFATASFTRGSKALGRI